MHLFADPQSADSGMVRALVLIKTADPAFALIIGAMPAEDGMDLMDEVQSELPVLLLSGFTIKPKEITDGEGVCP
jgi:DNA-binding response OmpR family regulator